MRRRGLSVALLGFVLLIVGGCGGEGGDSETGRSGNSRVDQGRAKGEKPAEGTQSQSGSARQAPKGGSQGGGSQASEPQPSAQSQPPTHHDSGGGAAQFRSRGGDNSVQEHGSEASPADFEEAAAVLHGYLDARAAGEWERACSFMASGIVGSLQRLAVSPQVGDSGEKKAARCADLLAAFSAGIPPLALREAAIADVGALRVEGDRGFLLFHGSQGSGYFMPMTNEGGQWKVAALAASALQ